MTVQEKMKAYRMEHGYSIEDMKWKTGASEVLLRMLEKGNVTHPKIAKKVGKAYHLTKEEIYELMPENHRPGEKYNPDKYKPNDSNLNNHVFFTKPESEKLIDAYYSDSYRTKHLKGRR